MKFVVLQSFIGNQFLFHTYLWLCSFPSLSAQFHFNNPATPERTNVPTSCKGPNGQESLCVPSSRCKQLSALLKNLQKPISGDVGKYIKDSFVCKKELKSSKKNEVCFGAHLKLDVLSKR